MSNILWIRRDLRIHDNPALVAAVENGVSIAVFISTPQQWQQHHLAPIKADFIYRHLKQLESQLAEFGISLLHLKASDFDDQARQLIELYEQLDAKCVYANSEPEVDEQTRDQQMISNGVNLQISSCDVMLPLGSVLNKQGEMFKVFTPFKNAWLKEVQVKGIICSPAPIVPAKLQQTQLQQTQLQQTQRPQSQLPDDLKASRISADYDFDFPRVDSSRWPLSQDVLGNVIPNFLTNKVNDYTRLRDIPSVKGTSGLSPYLAIGAVSPRWLAIQLIQQQPDLLFDTQLPAFSWLNELIWRDFYKHLMFHHPKLVKGANFQQKYNGLDWYQDHPSFKAWCEGKTGYPLVDAAMRQLVETGWMHNRLRMVVASFLTKHLLIDWRWGERFFMSHLIDGDFSANNGGWQWASSTGCDAQPYFRIFNPITQSEKFDPKGIFIRKYIPELQNIPDKHVHFPHDFIAKNGIDSEYWQPIVEHKQARLRALAFFK
ncbi:deoxyribodipyrimidine photolyase [Vibrio crassostreae]|uniref:Deoxyribodipyrimidine photo-lyase n=1 Tax=Vibrio crassostreae TaxID=246167 RepID=A0A822MYI6_9VIBR|nr:deoxyribodipyrimidine photo-lyase [Vibrio crassostreae]MDH5949020.1 deoxyribodipyrimidine photo-lyase [Vibrio crassostreae]ROO55834.1 deoxyribodipyrimidine photo-lyase [Vibrio crassostreae]ROO63733.1 deoxyribodipyrimidine photo-lyase [Vibrio crassostreae]ROO71453.1 deoxyribodipyrimidine photo-lyase [Vibrio crassostreae]ROO73657.1 deoxyribodipyrimidine photo-lyase [Vibrio crassostreae]